MTEVRTQTIVAAMFGNVWHDVQPGTFILDDVTFTSPDRRPGSSLNASNVAAGRVEGFVFIERGTGVTVAGRVKALQAVRCAEPPSAGTRKGIPVTDKETGRVTYVPELDPEADRKPITKLDRALFDRKYDPPDHHQD